MDSIRNQEIQRIWTMVYNLALSFAHNEELAEDATQEIFLKVNNSLSTFRKEALLSTWIYRIAFNYLVDQRRLKFKETISFELFEEDVNSYKPYENEINLSEKEMEIYVEQIKIGCTKAMLQCLDPIDRFVFILGKIFDFDGKTGAEICEMSESAYRQRLSRATRRITDFMTLNCGQINERATCHCKKRIKVALDRGRINPDMLLHHSESKTIKDYLGNMNYVDSIAKIFRDNPFIDKSVIFSDEIHKTVKKLSGLLD